MTSGKWRPFCLSLNVLTATSKFNFCQWCQCYNILNSWQWQWQWQWQWNNLYCQVTYKSCTESYDKDKASNRTIIHETYRTWQRGREAIIAYVPQYQLYQRDCFFFGVQSRNSAECWNFFNLMLFLLCTCMSYVYLKKNTYAHTYTCVHIFIQIWGWVGLWGFLWWAPPAKRKDHHGVSSGWSSVWHRSNTGLSSTQYEQIPIILGVWPFWLTPFFFRSITFGGLMVKLYFLCWNYSLSSGGHIIAA